jgi:ribosomal protein S16
MALDRIAYWAGVGAKLSPTVERLAGQAKAATAA